MHSFVPVGPNDHHLQPKVMLSSTQSGESCEVDVNECDSDPCHHGGTCIDQSNSFTCHCPPGWVGPCCEIRESACGEPHDELLHLKTGSVNKGLGDTVGYNNNADDIYLF